jgi:molybdenum cofactor cytidylyltransferase
MGYSIACAVNATTHSDGWCLLPADMPYLMASTTSELVDALRSGAVLAAPCYQGRRGHPVAFSQRFIDALCALDGDSGARHILEQNADRLTPIMTDDAGVLVDIDTPQDLEKPVNLT